jgi:3-deoxy-manno-octulosonate cytidylyltransferase (CMP-KDO synthetase)
VGFGGNKRSTGWLFDIQPIRRYHRPVHPETGESSSWSVVAASAVAVIPARYASTRFPAKPLARDTGKYLIQHTYERAQMAATIDRVIVATDDERIAEAVQSFGGAVVMTRADHPSGTDRVAEVAATLSCDLIVNVQGDEPELEPDSLDRLVQRMAGDPSCPMGTLACPFSTVPFARPEDPNAVKVVVDRRGRGLYFSRSLIPHPASSGTTGGPVAAPLLHVGVYAYRRDFLLGLADLEPTALERTERLEQLRVLEHGYAVAVVQVTKATVGIDTPQDYDAFVQRYRATSKDQGAPHPPAHSQHG